ncbi:hypothetical protein HY469_04935 [Candidatus Roizmanbacteria bacterium]|nr:hypothetical protein [Candidatus Roizmanbacteria bacterium]
MKNELGTVHQLSSTMRWKLWENGLRNSELFASITWLKRNPAEFMARTTDFHDVNQRISGYMGSQDELRRELRDVARLRTWYSGAVLPKVDDFHYGNNGVGVNGTIEDLLDEAVTTFPEWAVVHPEFPSHATPAMGALIEGYGSLLGRLHNGQDPELAKRIARTYVLGFEEVLLMERPESLLVDDVIGWVYDEDRSFPPELRMNIFKAARGFNERMKQQGQV